jgi:methionine sulfoxide reductase catalytic subunit
MNGNGEPLNLHGAPLRLRTETQLGYKMAKMARKNRICEPLQGCWLGTGRPREAQMYYSPGA